MKLIDNILTEWAYRVHDGMPNPKNPLHIIQLKEVMQYLEVNREVIDMVVSHLIGETKDDKYVSIGYGRYKEKGKEKDKNAPTFTKDDSGNYIPYKKGGDKKQTGKSETPPEPKITKIADNPFSADDEADDMKSDAAQQSKDDEDESDVQNTKEIYSIVRKSIKYK
jgi:hypothetical protein